MVNVYLDVIGSDFDTPDQGHKDCFSLVWQFPLRHPAYQVEGDNPAEQWELHRWLPRES